MITIIDTIWYRYNKGIPVNVNSIYSMPTDLIQRSFVTAHLSLSRAVVLSNALTNAACPSSILCDHVN